MKKFMAILLLSAAMLTAFSITAFADGDDNATGGGGSAEGAASGYGWYYSSQYLWKFTLYVGKSDRAAKSSNLQSAFYNLGTAVIKKPGWTVGSSVLFGSGTKVDYYSGADLAVTTDVNIISEEHCPAIPIACGGND